MHSKIGQSLQKKTLSILFGVSIFSVFVFSIGIAGTDSFQEFIKTNASWFSEKNYALIPLTEVTAATSPVSDAERVQSIVVRFSDGPLPAEVPFTTFSQFQPEHANSILSLYSPSCPEKGIKFVISCKKAP